MHNHTYETLHMHTSLTLCFSLTVFHVESSICTLEMSSDGKRFLCGTYDNTLSVYQLSPLKVFTILSNFAKLFVKKLSTVPLATSLHTCAAMIGDSVLVGTSDGKVVCWDLTTQSYTHEFEPGLPKGKHAKLCGIVVSAKCLSANVMYIQLVVCVECAMWVLKTHIADLFVCAKNMALCCASVCLIIEWCVEQCGVTSLEDAAYVRVTQCLHRLSLRTKQLCTATVFSAP